MGIDFIAFFVGQNHEASRILPYASASNQPATYRSLHRLGVKSWP